MRRSAAPRTTWRTDARSPRLAEAGRARNAWRVLVPLHVTRKRIIAWTSLLVNQHFSTLLSAACQHAAFSSLSARFGLAASLSAFQLFAVGLLPGSHLARRLLAEG